MKMMMSAALVVGLLNVLAPVNAAFAEIAVDRASAFGAKVILLEKRFTPPDSPIVLSDGAVTTLAEAKGNVTIVPFWATWCGVCRREMPNINALAGEMAAEGVKVLPVSLDASSAQVETYFAREGFKNLAVMIDQDRVNAGLLGIRGTPTAFILDRKGDVAAVIEGLGHWETAEAREYLRALAVESVD